MDRRPTSRICFLLIGFLLIGGLLDGVLTAAETDPQVASVLQSWESLRTDAGRDGWSVRALQPFVGPVQLAPLTERFTWSLRSSHELVGVPTDLHERQFLPTVQITIDETGIPQQITLGKQTHAVRDLVLRQVNQVTARESLDSSQGIVRVSFETAAPVAGSARVNQILSKWCAASQRAKAVRLTLKRIDYDSATEIESHSEGTFVYAAPHSGIYHSRPVTSPAETVRVGIRGEKYAVLPREESMLLWRGKDLVQIDNATRSYQVFERPGTKREILGAGSFDMTWQKLIAPQTALPLFVDLNEKDLRTNYEWELIADNMSVIILHGTPVSGPDASIYSSAQVVIDPTTWHTRATRMIDISTSRETVHEVTKSAISDTLKTLGHWEPDLTEYRKIGDAPGVEAADVVAEDLTPPAPPAERE